MTITDSDIYTRIFLWTRLALRLGHQTSAKRHTCRTFTNDGSVQGLLIYARTKHTCSSSSLHSTRVTRPKRRGEIDRSDHYATHGRTAPVSGCTSCRDDFDIVRLVSDGRTGSVINLQSSMPEFIFEYEIAKNLIRCEVF